MTTNADRARKAPAAKPRSGPGPVRARRPRRPSLGPDEFLDQALDHFLEKGFEGASIAAITASAGIAKRTVYQRYGDKKTLFKAALRRAIETWIVPVERLRAAEAADLEQSLLAIGAILVDNLLSPAGLRLIRVTNAVSGHMPDLGVYSVELGAQPTLDYLADLFRRRLAGEAGYPDAEDAAEAFLHLVVGGPGNAAAWGVVREKAAIDRRIRFSVGVFLHGLSPPGAESEPAATADAFLRLKRLLADAMIELDIVRNATP